MTDVEGKFFISKDLMDRHGFQLENVFKRLQICTIEFTPPPNKVYCDPLN